VACHTLNPSERPVFAGTSTSEYEKVSLTTVIRSKEVVRRILNLAARSWRHENGMTRLETAPLIANWGGAGKKSRTGGAETESGWSR
jgi:hypothetical protein